MERTDKSQTGNELLQGFGPHHESTRINSVVMSALKCYWLNVTCVYPHGPGVGRMFELCMSALCDVIKRGSVRLWLREMLSTRTHGCPDDEC
jgi:hypothetical protein